MSSLKEAACGVFSNLVNFAQHLLLTIDATPGPHLANVQEAHVSKY
jgi:hypothetical protein